MAVTVAKNNWGIANSEIPKKISVEKPSFSVFLRRNRPLTLRAGNLGFIFPFGRKVKRKCVDEAESESETRLRADALLVYIKEAFIDNVLIPPLSLNAVCLSF